AGMKPPSTEWDISLKSPLWERAAAAGFNRIRAIPTQEGFGSDWRDPGYFAVTHGMETDIAYLGRIDRDKLAALRAHQEEVLVSGDFEPRTIYILDLRAAYHAVRHRGPDDLLAVVDRRIVFLRNGRALADGLEITPI